MHRSPKRKKSNPHGLVRHGFTAPCGRAAAPPTRCRRRHSPRRPPSPWHLHLPWRGGILRVRYAASRPTDCSCRQTRSPVPRPPSPSSMRMLDECSGASVPRRATSFAAPRQGSQERSPSLARPRPGAGATGRCQAAPPSTAAKWPEPAVTRSALHRTEER